MAIWVHSLTVLLCLCIQKEFPWNLIHFPRRRQFPTDGVANLLINGHLVARLQAERNGCRVELVFPLGQQFDNEIDFLFYGPSGPIEDQTNRRAANAGLGISQYAN